MDFTGKIIYKGAKETVGQNGFEKLSIVLEEISDKDYKSSLMIEFFKEKIELAAPLKMGDTVKVYLNPRAKEYNGRWYNSVSCWKIDMISQGSGKAASSEESYDDNEDLPF